MKSLRSVRAALVAFALVVGGSLLVQAAHARAGAPPVRLVAATISVDGVVVLRASTSDDGRPDADEVWGYLIDRLAFQPTEAFAALELDPAAETVTLGWLKSRANEHLGEPPALQVEVAYGGSDAPYRLGLARAAGQETWRVARETVERRFSHRRITRAQAAMLVDPERKQ
jgi:hypothetical protein